MVIRDKYHVIDLSAEYTYSDKIQFTIGHVRVMREATCALEESSMTAAFTTYQMRSIYDIKLEAENFLFENCTLKETKE